MIRNVVFDLGGVVVEWNPEKIIRSWPGDNSPFGKLEQSPFFREVWSDFDRGVLSREEVIRKAMEITGCSYREACGFLDHLKESLVDIPETIALIRQLSEKGYRLFCLSNMSVDIYEYLKERPVFRLFEGKLISAEEGVIKPDPAIFRLLLDRYALLPQETLFIDDLAPNAEAAARLGIHTICFTADRRGYDQIKAMTVSST